MNKYTNIIKPISEKLCEICGLKSLRRENPQQSLLLWNDNSDLWSSSYFCWLSSVKIGFTWSAKIQESVMCSGPTHLNPLGHALLGDPNLGGGGLKATALFSLPFPLIRIHSSAKLATSGGREQSLIVNAQQDSGKAEINSP